MPLTRLRADLHWISAYSTSARRGSGASTLSMIEQMFAVVLTGWVGGGRQIKLNSAQAGRWGRVPVMRGGPPKGMSGRYLAAFGRVVDDGQKSFRMHSSQRGRRAMQIRRPCRIRRSDKPVHSSLGTIEQT